MEHIERRVAELASLPQTDDTRARIHELKNVAMWVGKKAVSSLGQKTTGFKCYEIHTVQAKMFGCTEQCAECQARELIMNKN